MQRNILFLGVLHYNSSYILRSLEPLFEMYKKEVEDLGYEDDFGIWLEELSNGKEIDPPC